jgi:hypothetical protein
MCWTKAQRERLETADTHEPVTVPQEWTAPGPPVEETEPRQADEREQKLVEA